VGFALFSLIAMLLCRRVLRAPPASAAAQARQAA